MMSDSERRFLMKKNKSLLKVLVGAGLGLHLSNQYISYNAKQNAFLREDEGSFYYSRLGKVFYTKEGEGSPILLIHQLSPLASGYEWQATTEKLIRNHTVYTLDLLGCGRSEKPDLVYTNFLYVTLILDFISNVIRQSVPIVSSRESGAIALMAKKYDPQWISKILLINPMSLEALKDSPDDASRRQGKLFTLPLIGETLYNIYFARSTMACVFDSDTQKKAAYDASHRDHSRGRFLYSSLLTRFTRINTDKALVEAGNYAAVLFGDKSLWHEDILNEYTKTSPEVVVFETLANCKHPHIEKPDETIEIIEKYLF